MFARVLLLTFLAMALAWSVLARGSEGAGVGQRYQVEAGDTLWSIATTHYGGDPRSAVWRLQSENHLRDPTLRPGQILRLP